jgi:hypothetical protein
VNVKANLLISLNPGQTGNNDTFAVFQFDFLLIFFILQDESSIPGITP